MIIGSLFNDETLTYPCRTITDIGQDVDQYSITLFPEYAMRDEKYRFGGLKANYNPKNISKIAASFSVHCAIFSKPNFFGQTPVWR